MRVLLLASVGLLYLSSNVLAEPNLPAAWLHLDNVNPHPSQKSGIQQIRRLEVQRDSKRKSEHYAAVALAEPGLLDPMSEPNCQFETNDPKADERQKLDYERQCYRHAEKIVRSRLEQLQSAIEQAGGPRSQGPQGTRAQHSLAAQGNDDARGPVTSSDRLAWRVVVEPKLGTEVALPTGLFLRTQGETPRGTGQMYATADGRAALALYSQNNTASKDTPARYVKQNLQAPPNTLDYKRIAPTFFAISGVSDGRIYYSRCNFSNRLGGAIHCFDMVYPEREKRAWDAIVTRISLSLRPLVRH
jgi:hypothetical protein